MINNKFELIGRIAKDIKLEASQSGKVVTRVTIAVDMGKDANGNKKATFPRVVVWEKKAEYLGNYAKKGDLIKADGRIDERSWQDQQGNWKNSTDLIAEEVQILSHAEPRNSQSNNQYQAIRNTRQNDGNGFSGDDNDYPFGISPDDLPF